MTDQMTDFFREKNGAKSIHPQLSPNCQNVSWQHLSEKQGVSAELTNLQQPFEEISKNIAAGFDSIFPFLTDFAKKRLPKDWPPPKQNNSAHELSDLVITFKNVQL